MLCSNPPHPDPLPPGEREMNLGEITLNPLPLLMGEGKGRGEGRRETILSQIPLPRREVAGI